MVTAYNNATEAFQFTDTNSLAVVNNVLTLFTDDGKGVGGTVLNEGTTDDIARLRLYNEVLTPDQVASLAVPEPSALGILVSGGTLLGLVGLRRHLA